MSGPISPRPDWDPVGLYVLEMVAAVAVCVAGAMWMLVIARAAT